MNKRSKLAALLGAGLLTFGVAGMALAYTGTLLNPGQVGEKLSDAPADANCATDFPGLAAGEVGVHFVLTSTTADNTESLAATFSTDSFDVTGADKTAGPNVLQWFQVITGDGDTTIDAASTDSVGNNLNLSHVCFGAPAPTPTPTLPGGGGAGDTDQPPTDALGTSSGSSGPSDTAWLLVVGLGVLLASIVVLTPARAKSRR